MLRSFASAIGRVKVRGRSLSARLATAERHELEQAGLRVTIVGLVLCYLIYQVFAGAGGAAKEVAWVALATFGVSVALLVRILYAGGTSVTRRIFGMVVDNTATSYCLLQMEATGAIIIGVYLFVTFGNGFRYGRKYLHLCQGMAILGFGLVLILSNYWRSHASLSIGLMLALLVLPFYVAVLTQRITEAMRRADEANRAKGRFLANMSHEMRTPLNGVIAMADVLRETSLTASQVEIVETMTTSAQLLLAQIEDVLDMAKIEAGRVTIERSPFDLSRLMSTTVKVLLPQARYKSLDFQLDISDDACGWYEGDPHHLRQVVLNLISNAIKFTERGSVHVKVTVSSKEDKEHTVRVCVRDTGVGIPLEKQALIFEPFTQADNSITRVYGGTGLGTTIARHLAALMGGVIGLESEVGKGSNFWVEVPLTRTHARTPEPSDDLSASVRTRANAQGSSSTSGGVRRIRRARVLVAEDNATNQRVAQLILESGGHDVCIVDNGEKALDALEREKFDIALFDLSMPVVSGLEALKMYRFTTKTPIPVLVLSANVTPEAIEECYGAGAAEFVPKPLRASLLLESIDRQLTDSSTSSCGPRIEPSPIRDESTQFSVIRTIDLDEAVLANLRRLSTDPTFVDRLLRGFWSDAERLLREISSALKDRKFEVVKDCGHALKGGAASVGAQALAQFAARLEKSSIEALKSNTPQWTREMSQTARRTKERIDTYLEHQTRNRASPG